MAIARNRCRYRSACLIQARWRGLLVRRWAVPLLAARRQASREARGAELLRGIVRRHGEQRARAALERHVPRIREWLRAVAGARAERERERAAVAMQAAARAWAARRWAARAVRGVVRVQALWRGWRVRKADGRQKAEMRRRLAAAAAACTKAPHKTLGARVREALEQLLSRRDPAQVCVLRCLFA